MKTVIIEKQQDVTTAVLSELQRAGDVRFKEIMSAFVRHLHDFAREVKLTEEEFQRAIGYVVALGRHTTDTHNEAVLMSGSLGFSSLICLLNNGNNGQTETSANLLGPFWRMDSPATPNGGSIVRSATPGPALFVNAWFRDAKGQPVAGAEVDVWHSSPEGFYENQDPAQADMNLRGKFTTDKDGHISFRSVKPAGYPIPVDGPGFRGQYTIFLGDFPRNSPSKIVYCPRNSCVRHSGRQRRWKAYFIKGRAEVSAVSRQSRRFRVGYSMSVEDRIGSRAESLATRISDLVIIQLRTTLHPDAAFCRSYVRNASDRERMPGVVDRQWWAISRR